MKKSFDKMTKCEKRVALAKDIILQLKKGVYNTKSTVYFETHSEYLLRKLSSKDLQQKMLTNPPICTVCEKGAMILSKIRLGNGIDGQTLCNFSGHENPMPEIFSNKQWKDLEYAFELFHSDLTGEIKAAKKYKFPERLMDRDTSSRDERMIRISKYIIKHKGILPR